MPGMERRLLCCPSRRIFTMLNELQVLKNFPCWYLSRFVRYPACGFHRTNVNTHSLTLDAGVSSSKGSPQHSKLIKVCIDLTAHRMALRYQARLSVSLCQRRAGTNTHTGLLKRLTMRLMLVSTNWISYNPPTSRLFTGNESD
jgi:hypothetical protein